jgi:outer membrane immunogenic protein
MKRSLLAVAALAFTAGSTLAADLPTRKAPAYLPPPPPPPMWTGFYAGLNAGYNFGTNSNANAAVTTSPYSYTAWGPEYAGYFPVVPLQGVGLTQSGSIANTQNGFIGGGQIGYNFQYGSHIVIGIETDFQGTTASGSGRVAGANAVSNNLVYYGNSPYQDTVSAAGGTVVQAGVNWIGTVRGKVGYLFTPTLLAYATGGFAYGSVYANVAQTGFASGVDAADITYGSYSTFSMPYLGGGRISSVLPGYSVGGGLEWMFWPNWSVKAEAIYWNLGNKSLTSATLAPGVLYYSAEYGAMDPSSTVGRINVNYQGVIARAGVNYHFNWGAATPVVARY